MPWLNAVNNEMPKELPPTSTGTEIFNFIWWGCCPWNMHCHRSKYPLHSRFMSLRTNCTKLAKDVQQELVEALACAWYVSCVPPEKETWRITVFPAMLEKCDEGFQMDHSSCYKHKSSVIAWTLKAFLQCRWKVAWFSKLASALWKITVAVSM